MCRGAMLASQCSPRSGRVAATEASRVRLPSSEGLFFASRARHAAAARLPRIPSSYIGAWGSVWAEQQRRKSALRCAQRQCSGFLVRVWYDQLTRVNATTRDRKASRHRLESPLA